MKIAIWNVNSIKARKDHVLKWLQDTDVDVLMVQELKGTAFPANDFEAIGYQSQAVTQKAYNGVATFSKGKTETILKALPGDEEDEQARYLELQLGDIRLINIYLPNGNPVDTEKFDYKLAWMDRLYARLKQLRDDRIPFVIGGDFNVIPEGHDCFNPSVWENDALFRLETRQRFRALCNLGLTEAYRALKPNDISYTFWDYQGGSWPANKGIRIDHFLLSPPLTDRLEDCTIDKTPRGWGKPSDHTPVILTLTE